MEWAIVNACGNVSDVGNYLRFKALSTSQTYSVNSYVRNLFVVKRDEFVFGYFAITEDFAWLFTCVVCVFSEPFVKNK